MFEYQVWNSAHTGGASPPPVYCTCDSANMAPSEWRQRAELSTCVTVLTSVTLMHEREGCSLGRRLLTRSLHIQQQNTGVNVNPRGELSAAARFIYHLLATRDTCTVSRVCTFSKSEGLSTYSSMNKFIQEINNKWVFWLLHSNLTTYWRVLKGWKIKTLNFQSVYQNLNEILHFLTDIWHFHTLLLLLRYVCVSARWTIRGVC